MMMLFPRFIKSIKKMLNDSFPNKKILFEMLAAGHDLILRHFVINSKDDPNYKWAYDENFIPFETVFSDTGMWDSGNSGNKKVMNATAMGDHYWEYYKYSG